MSGFAVGAALTHALVGQIPLSPPLNTRLITLVVVEIALAILVVLLYLKYKQLKSVPLDEWWARRLEDATPRMRRMIRESQEIYEQEQAAARGEQAVSHSEQAASAGEQAAAAGEPPPGGAPPPSA
jgi:hypothetical protein